jgi:beta-glucanase (GH16 family)
MIKMTHISLAVLLFSLEGSLYAQLFSQDAIPPGYRQPSCDYIKKTHEFNSFPTTFCQRASGWILDFSEEFNGDELDPDKWAIQNENCHAMSPSAYFSNSPENVRVEDGKLKLRVKESDAFDCTDPNTNPPVMKRYYYSGGWVVSQDNFHYGYFEMKCYIPGDIGLYPCFWMYGTIWPYMMTDYDEIDVFEKSLDDPSNTMLMQNYYHDTGLPGWQRLCQTLEFNQLYVGQENIFAVEWLPEEITFYIRAPLITTF